MKSMNLLATLYAQQVKEIFVARGFRDNNTLSLIEEIAKISFYDGAKESIKIVTEMMNEIVSAMRKEDKQ